MNNSIFSEVQVSCDNNRDSLYVSDSTQNYKYSNYQNISIDLKLNIRFITNTTLENIDNYILDILLRNKCNKSFEDFKNFFPEFFI